MGTIINYLPGGSNKLNLPHTASESTTDYDMDWYRLFRHHITEEIDVEPFRKMFKQGEEFNHLRQLVAMVIMTDYFNRNEHELLFHRRVNAKLRFALGFNRLMEVPSMAVLSAFRNMLKSYEKTTGTDLIRQTIQQITDRRGPVFKVGEQKLMLWAVQVA